jgi:hypothetical protein
MRDASLPTSLFVLAVSGQPLAATGRIQLPADTRPRLPNWGCVRSVPDQVAVGTW